LTLRDTTAPQFVGHDDPRHILQTLQQSLEEPLCSVGIAPRLDKDIQHNAILIDGAPKIMLHTQDPDEHLIEVPLISGSWSTTSQTIGEIRPEFLPPAPYRLVGDVDATLSQDQLNIPQAEAEHVDSQTAWLMISAGNR
jgi:hypothetical protein